VFDGMQANRSQTVTAAERRKAVRPSALLGLWIVNVSKICLIYNAQAGGASNVETVLHRYAKQLAGEICPAEGPGETQRLARDAVRRVVGRLVIAGGDGTVNLVVNALAPAFGETELALLPLGTGNDLARSLGLPDDDVDESARIAF